jgi:hypothetical protein
VVWIVGWLELLCKTGAESVIIDGATNLKQQIGAASRPAHLLGFIHLAVHQEIGRSFGERGRGVQREHLLQQVSRRPIGQEGGKMCLKPTQFWRRPAM